MPIRVLQLLQGLAIGGIERMVLSLAFHLDPSKFETQFSTFRLEGALATEVRERGMGLHFRKWKGAWDLGHALWLAKFLRRSRIQILHAHNAGAFFCGALATQFARGTRLLYTEHDRAFPSPWRDRLLHGLLARRADAVVTVSETLCKNLVRYESFPRNRVHVIPNGVECRVPRTSRGEMRAELGLGTRPVAGIVARLAPVKNHVLLLRAWKRVLEWVPDAVLLVVGSGSQEPNARRVADELELGDAVRFLGFRLDIQELLGAMDVFVLSSRSEGLSLTLLEAASASLPVVATRVGGNPEVVQEGKTGFLVPTEAPEPLARALAHLLQDAELRARLGAQARSFYLEHHTVEAMVGGYANLYRRLSGQTKESCVDVEHESQIVAGSRA